ncbi:hypothetical protein [Microlunatus speluncae]|nr:hypothetical protein [Microlunatus speluncae]
MRPLIISCNVTVGSSMFADVADRRTLKLNSLKGFPSGMVDVTYAAQ